MKKHIDKREIELMHRRMRVADELLNVAQDSNFNTRLEDYPNLKDFLESTPNSKDFICTLAESKDLEDSTNKTRDIEKFNAIISEEISKRRTKLRIRAIVSSVVAAVIFVSFMIYNNRPDSQPVTSQEEVVIANNEVKIDKPIIIVGNSEIISIDSESEDGATKISTTELVSMSSVAVAKEEVISTNKIIVPTKYTTTLTLDDGTTVYLNADSELEFPTKFIGSERRVKLKGEGYFDVVKSTKPFIVDVENISINVLGTKFNINANNHSVSTCLVEGSVEVEYNGGQQAVVIKPNDLCVVDIERQEAKTEQVNPQNYISWMGDTFIFNNQNIGYILECVDRWYGVDIELQSDSVKSISATIAFDKSTELESVLKMIELSTGVKFIKEKGGRYKAE